MRGADGVSPTHTLTSILLQEALSIYQEAVQKMPPQFAPHSLFNMMGKATRVRLDPIPRVPKLPHVRFGFEMLISIRG